MADYENVCKGKLKLKSGSGEIKKKKNRKEKERKLKEAVEASNNLDESVTAAPKKTPAELAFEKVKEKRTFEEVLKKATKTHKERILEFNNKLDSLTEHFDIPKVSWTK